MPHATSFIFGKQTFESHNIYYREKMNPVGFRLIWITDWHTVKTLRCSNGKNCEVCLLHKKSISFHSPLRPDKRYVLRHRKSECSLIMKVSPCRQTTLSDGFGVWGHGKPNIDSFIFPYIRTWCTFQTVSQISHVRQCDTSNKVMCHAKLHDAKCH